MANSQDGWSYDTLQRATLLSRQTFIRASTRVVDWPKEKPRYSDGKEKCATLENAFQNIMNCMEETTRQCQGYYASHPPRKVVEKQHCHRFHKPDRLVHNSNANSRDNVACCRSDQCSLSTV